MAYFVFCAACDTEHTVDEVNVLNIEEDIQGRDVLTFECPLSNTKQNSLVYGDRTE